MIGIDPAVAALWLSLQYPTDDKFNQSIAIVDIEAWIILVGGQQIVGNEYTIYEITQEGTSLLVEFTFLDSFVEDIKYDSFLLLIRAFAQMAGWPEFAGQHRLECR